MSKIIHFISSQISSFSVTPNYEILFFSSEIFEVVNIIDFLDGKISNLKAELDTFNVIGEWHISEISEILS